MPVLYEFNLLNVGVSLDISFASKFYTTLTFANNTAAYDDSLLSDHFSSQDYTYEAEPIIGDTMSFSLGYAINESLSFETTYKKAMYGYWIFLMGPASILQDDVLYITYSAVTAGFSYSF